MQSYTLFITYAHVNTKKLHILLKKLFFLTSNPPKMRNFASLSKLYTN